jgi:hypothetical protein
MTSPLGKFVWYEYMGNDLKAAVDFYTHVVGWNAKDSSMPGMAYEILSAGTIGVAGMMDIPVDAKAMGAQPCWLGYIWVEDVEAFSQKVIAAGGQTLKPSADIPGVGRFAVVADPGGAIFMLFHDANGNPPAPRSPGTPGLIGWHELHAGDGEKALAFYSGLFGWKHDRDFDMGAMGLYRLFSTGYGENGGLMTKTPQTPRPFWLYYFNVEAIDAAAERIKAKGGKIAFGPMEVPGGAWTLQAFDPQGALFALVAPQR